MQFLKLFGELRKTIWSLFPVEVGGNSEPREIRVLYFSFKIFYTWIVHYVYVSQCHNNEARPVLDVARTCRPCQKWENIDQTNVRHKLVWKSRRSLPHKLENLKKEKDTLIDILYQAHFLNYWNKHSILERIYVLWSTKHAQQTLQRLPME